MTPRSHSKLIKAWADGAQIQIQLRDKVWVDLDDPVWGTQSKYRIKPVQVEVLTALRQSNKAKDMVISEHPMYALPNVKCVFDGDTGKLLSVEVI